MDIILRGQPQEIEFVCRICRDKVRRGVLAILPATAPAPAPMPEAGEGDTKDVIIEDSKDAPKPTLKRTRTKKSE